MHELKCAWMTFIEINTCDATIIHLSEKLTEVGSALMPHPCIREQSRLVASLNNTIGEVDVLTKAHLRETP